MLAVIASIAVGIAMFGTTVFLSQYMQIARGKSPTESGLLTIPMVTGLFLASTFIGRLVSRTGRYKRFLLIGAALLTVGLGLMGTLDETTSLVELGAFMFVMGAGVGMLMQNLVLVVQNTVRFEDIGAGSSLVAFFRSLGGAIGVSVLGALLAHHASSDITSGLAEPASRRPAAPTRCPTSPRCPRRSPTSSNTPTERAWGRSSSPRPRSGCRPRRGRAPARGAARRQERDRHRPRAGVHPRPARSDRMSVATTPEPAAVLGELKLHRLLVAIDGSANAELALTAAITAARRDNATITLITVGPDLATGPAAWSVPVAGTVDQGAVDDDCGKRMKGDARPDPGRHRRPHALPPRQAGPGDRQGGQGGRLRRDHPRRPRRRPRGRADGQRLQHVLHHADIAVFVAHAPKEQRAE